MIIAWMLYSLLLSTLVLAGGYAVERVVRLLGYPTRWVWLGALAISLMVPAILPLLPERAPEQATIPIIPVSFTIPLDAPPLAVDASWTVPQWIGAGWVALSVLLVLLGVVAALRLRSARRNWRRSEMLGAEVLISGDTGPAVIGFLRPVVVVPEWVTTLPESNQQLVLTHERAHIRARDPLLVIFAHVAPALLPWNAAVWLQARRLRECVELDCDARVLADSANPNGYAELLLAVGRRASFSPMLVAALTEPRSLLERRIRRLLERQPRRRWLRASAWGLAAMVAILCAFRAPLPGEPVTLTDMIERPRLVVHPETELPLPLPQDTSAPRLLNPAEVETAAQRNYPPLVKDAGISGTPRVWVFVDADGAVRSTRISQGSSHKALDEAALRVAQVMRFAPAQFRGRAVSKWIEVAVDFKSDRDAAEEIRRAREKLQNAAIERVNAATEFRAVPRLSNPDVVVRGMVRYYPPLLRDAGIGGTAIVWLFIEKTGEVTKLQLKRSAGHTALDEAALKVAELATFTPALLNDQPAASWIEVPITFKTNGSVELGTMETKRIEGQEEQDRRIEEARKLRAVEEELKAKEVDVTAAPTFTPYTVSPQMTNAGEVVRAMQQYYPPLLRDAGIGGTIIVWFLIDETGNVMKTQLKKTSGHQALDEAGLAVARMAKFNPALNRDERVKVWIELPIQFKTQQPEQPAATQSRLFGVVTDPAGRPIPGAQVSLVETSRGSLTTPDGRFMVNTAPGTYTMMVTAPGFGSSKREVVISSSGTRVDFQFVN